MEHTERMNIVCILCCVRVEKGSVAMLTLQLLAAWEIFLVLATGGHMVSK